MRLPATAHTSRAWRIHEIAPDFRLEDVWEVPCQGGPEDFPRLVQMLAAGNATKTGPFAVRALSAIRFKVGRVLGWDADEVGLGSRVPSLRERLPPDLRDTPTPDSEGLPLNPLYQLDEELAAEIANRTMHGVLHLSWVPADGDGYRGQMAVLVKPNGVMGDLYMAAIKPFRYLIFYPAMLRSWERAWERRRYSRPVVSSSS